MRSGGNFSIRPNLPVCEYSVTNIDDIKCKIIPFLDKYPLQGVKLLDYLAFKKAVLLKPDKRVPITKEVLEEIRQIKTGMNRGRLKSTESSDKKFLVLSPSTNKILTRPLSKVTS